MIIFSPSLRGLLSAHARLSYEELLSIDREALRQMRNQGCSEEYIKSIIGDNYEVLTREAPIK